MTLQRRTLMTTLAGGALALAGAGGAGGEDARYTIALSNGWVGSEWRTQMVEEAVAAAEAWKERGVDVEVTVQSKNVDVQGQIADVRNFMNQGVDAIIINPNSPTAFNPTFAQAKARGIPVYATDGEVTSPDATFVGIDQKAWAEASAEWLAEELGGEGRIVAINGVAGHPANQARVEGLEEVMGEYPDIEIVAQANADWDNAKAQQTAQTLLATYPDIDGVWTQDGMADGLRRALENAGKEDVLAVGELRASFVREWADKGWNTAASINPPAVMADALHVAVLRLQGHELKDGIKGGPNGNALYIPVQLVTSEGVDEAVAELEGAPNYAALSDIKTIEEIEELFFK